MSRSSDVPEDAPVSFDEIRRIFLAALARAASDRDAYLEEACSGRESLRREVVSLLRAADTAHDGFVRDVDERIGFEAASALVDATCVPAAGTDPSSIGAYRVTKRLGAGGMGVVYEAEDPRLQRSVAIKTLPVSLAGGSEAWGRLEREARILARMNHPNIATVYSLEEHEGTRFLTMERILGESLAERLARGVPALDETLRIARRVARALEAAHEANVIHRDLKPSNVMLNERGEPKVLDFGIAEEPGARGVVAGTPGYMSPEQLRGTRFDERTDIFAFGCLLHECLGGRRAFPGSSATERAHATLHAQPTLEALPLGIPSRIVALVGRCLAHEPNERPAGMCEVRTTLEEVIEETRLARWLERDGSRESRHAHNLPRRMTRFVGRVTEMADVRARLAERPLVTLTGLGGSGKSRLAIEVGQEMVAIEPDGVWHVDLAPIADPDVVFQAPLACLGLRESARRSALESLVAGLEPKRLLLVLDNCEHVLAPVRAMVASILEKAPNVKILATSRESLGVDGELAYAVPPLRVPTDEPAPSIQTAQRSEAVRLFAERAAMADPSFRLTPENLAPVIEVCRRLDGLPLALELAAGRVATLALPELVRRLDARLDMLTRRTGSEGARHATLRSAIEWSHDQLDEPERAVFRRLAVFCGGFTMTSAEQVTSGGVVHAFDVLEILSRLVEKSLVSVRTEGEGSATHTRFELLETLRLYARERLLASGEAEAYRCRHRDHYLALVVSSELTGASRGGEPAARAIDGELANVRQVIEGAGAVRADAPIALRLCVLMAPYWELRGHWSEGRRNLDRFLDLSDGAELGIPAARALYWSAKLAKEQGDFEAASARASACRALAERHGDGPTTADALQVMGNVAEYRGAVEDAQEFYEQGLEIARALDDPHRLAIALGNLGVVAKDRRDYPRARSYYEQALELFRKLGDRRSSATSLNNLGATAYYESDLPGARAYFEQALALRRELQDKSGIAASLQNLVQMELALGKDPRAARPMLQAALRMRAELGQQFFVATSLLALAELAADLGEPENAACWFAAAGTLRARIQAQLDPAERDAIEARVEGLRRTLDPTAFAAAWLRGETLPVETIVEEALGDSSDKRDPV